MLIVLPRLYSRGFVLVNLIDFEVSGVKYGVVLYTEIQYYGKPDRRHVVKRFLIFLWLFVLFGGCAAVVPSTLPTATVVVSEATPTGEKKCVSGCELSEVLSRDLEIDQEGDVQASLKDFSIDRLPGDLYHDPNGVLNVETQLQVDYPVNGQVVTETIIVTNPASIAGYYLAPNGLWYAIAIE